MNRNIENASKPALLPPSFLWSHFARQGVADDEALLLIQCCSCSECTLYSYSTALCFCSSFYFYLFYMDFALLCAIVLPPPMMLLCWHTCKIKCVDISQAMASIMLIYFSPPPDIHYITIKR